MGTPYYVRVTAYNSLGGSSVGVGIDNSNVAAVTPNQVPSVETWYWGEFQLPSQIIANDFL